MSLCWLGAQCYDLNLECSPKVSWSEVGIWKCDWIMMVLYSAVGWCTDKFIAKCCVRKESLVKRLCPWGHLCPWRYMSLRACLCPWGYMFFLCSSIHFLLHRCHEVYIETQKERVGIYFKEQAHIMMGAGKSSNCRASQKDDSSGKSWYYSLSPKAACGHKFPPPWKISVFSSWGLQLLDEAHQYFEG